MSATPHHPERDAEVLRKHKAGWTYAELARHFSIHPGKAWIICNRARHNVNSRESKARYYARGGKALVDCPHA